jgi:hypothetical protein
MEISNKVGIQYRAILAPVEKGAILNWEEVCKQITLTTHLKNR